MKKTILIAFTALTMASNAFTQSFEKEMINGRDETSDVFITRKNGEKIIGKKMTFSKVSVWRFTQKEYWIAVDDQKVDLTQEKIIGYQSNKKYVINYYNPDFENGGYAEAFRLRYGKINLFYWEELDKKSNKSLTVEQSRNIVDYFESFLFDNNDGKGLRELTFENFEKAIKNNAEAVDLLRKLYPTGEIRKKDGKKNLKNLIQVVELYNK